MLVRILGGFVHCVDLVGDSRNVLSGVGFSWNVELVLRPQVREESEELLQGVVQVGGHALLGLGVTVVLTSEAETWKMWLNLWGEQLL